MACPSCDKKIRVPAGKSGSSGTITASAPPPLSRDNSDDETAIEDQPTPRKSPALVRKSATEENDADDIPVRPRPPKLRNTSREDEEDRPRKRRALRDEDFEDESEDVEDIADEDEDDEKPRKRRKKRKEEGGTVVAVTGMIGSIGSLLFVVLFFIIISGAGPRWLMDFIDEKLRQNGIPPLLAIGITAAVFLVPMGLWILVTLKSTILNAMPDEISFNPTKPSKFRNLDVDQLDQYTEELESLGFKQAIDYTVRTELEHFPSGFARLFINEEDGCYAEINQGFTPDGEAVPMRCVITSHMEDDWALSTTDRTPSKESYLMRRPRAAWRSLPDKDPADLLSHHLKMRKRMLKALEIDLSGSLSSKAYFAREEKANRERKEVVRGRWTIGMLIEFFFFDRNPKFEWLGEYAEAA